MGYKLDQANEDNERYGGPKAYSSPSYRGALLLIDENAGEVWDLLGPCLQDAGIRYKKVSCNAADDAGQCVLDAYCEQQRFHPLPNLIAQGLGSEAVRKLLRSGVRLILRRIILFESTLDKNFDWRRVATHVGRVLNEVCPKESWKSRSERPEVSPAGCVGFTKCSFVQNIEHSDANYLHKLYFEDVWLPFLQNRWSIFLSYRRAGSKHIVGRIYDRLIQRFSPGYVFRDYDSIPYGADFQEFFEAKVGESHIVLVVIDPDWLDARTSDGRRRLDQEDDPVRNEIAIALGSGSLTIPVLVRGASMPAKADLPTEIEGLAGLQAFVVREEPGFSADVDRLIDELLRHLCAQGP